MKSLNEYIEENESILILEEFLSKCKDYNLTFDIGEHGKDRYFRDVENDVKITRDEVIYTLYKVVHRIDEYINDNIITNLKRFNIVDKSRNINLHIICEYNADDRKVFVVTLAKRKSFFVNDVVTTFETYVTDSKIKKDYKLR